MIVWYTLHIIFNCAITNKKKFISFFHSTTVAYRSEKCKQKVCAIPTHKAYWIFHRYIIHKMEQCVVIHREKKLPPNENPLKNIIFLLITKMDSFVFVYVFTINRANICKTIAWSSSTISNWFPGTFITISLPHSLARSLFLLVGKSV